LLQEFKFSNKCLGYFPATVGALLPFQANMALAEEKARVVMWFSVFKSAVSASYLSGSNTRHKEDQSMAQQVAGE
jgi:hypothetical protein